MKKAPTHISGGELTMSKENLSQENFIQDAVAVSATEATEVAAEPSLFATFGLHEALLGNITRMGYTQPTPVQARSIPAAMKGGDWMVSSQTGSGKTAAYLLPLLNAILNTDAKASPMQRAGGPVAPQAIVLCPTRELAQQVAAEAIELVLGMRGVRIATIVGGMPFGKQIAALAGARLVVATPGRLMDLQQQRRIRLDSVKLLVVDEADRMLDLGFAEDLEHIAGSCSEREQTLMYSATFAPRIMQLATQMMNNPGRLELASAQDRHADITQVLHWADNHHHKRKLLDYWLRDASVVQMVVFASTQIETQDLADELAEQGFAVAALHGAMPQVLRNRRLQSLRDGRIKILVATDVAARGIDVPTISHVVNYGLPMKAEDYVHRIGRTGRAGRSGQAITLAEVRERHKIRDIERFTQQTLNAQEIAGLEPTIRKPAKGGFGDARRGGPGGGARGNNNGFSGAPRGGFKSEYKPAEKRAAWPATGFTTAATPSSRPSTSRFAERKAPSDRWVSDQAPAPRNFADKPFADKPFGERKFADKPFGERKFADKPFGERKFADNKFSDNKFASPKPREGGFGDRKQADAKSFADRPFPAKSFGAKPPFGAKPAGEKPFGAKPFGAKPFGAKPFEGRPSTKPARTGFANKPFDGARSADRGAFASQRPARPADAVRGPKR